MADPGTPEAVAAHPAGAAAAVRLVEVFRDFARCAAGPFDVTDVLRELAAAATRLLDVEGVAVVHRVGERMRLVQASTGATRDAELLQEALQDGPCREARRSAALVVEEDLGSQLDRWPEFTVHAAAQGLHAVASVPLVARGEVWGALDLFRALPGPFAAQDLQTAQVLAEVACGYVLAAHDRDQARRAQQRAAHAATHDPLTGLPNRALLVDRLAHAVATAQRRGTPLAVLFLDLDGFKQVNDTHGHHVGDLLLAEVAHRLGAAVRVEDTVARLGGDEFVVVCEDLPPGATGGVTAGSLGAVLARIRAVMTRPARLAGVQVRVGVSIGVAVTSPSRAVAPAAHVEEVLRTADQAMYRAKRRAKEGAGERVDVVVDLPGPGGPAAPSTATGPASGARR